MKPAEPVINTVLLPLTVTVLCASYVSILSPDTNKVLVLFNLPVQKGASNLRIATALHRGGSNIYNANLESCFNNQTHQATETVSGMFLDSPATTSAVTYYIRVRVSSGSGTFYWAVSGCVCTLTAMEVSG